MVKILIGCLLTTVMFSAFAVGDEFCDGFEKGYMEGYCYRQPFCIQPIQPICPIRRFGESTYTDGYQRGFLQGVSKLR